MSDPGTMLVLTEPFDPTADLVIEKLNTRGLSVFRADAADFPHTLDLEARICGESWVGSLRTAHRQVALEEICAVWYRRPSRFQFPGLSEPERRFAAAQARAGFGGVLASLPCRWVNHPHAIGRAEYKASQLPAAAACGLNVPNTLITSDPRAQHSFAESQADGLITKPLSAATFQTGETAHFTYTHVVPASEWGDPRIATTAHLFQSWIPKDFEVRLTVVGEELFPAAIHAKSQSARIDWRSDYAHLVYTDVEVPEPIRSSIASLMRHFDLSFAAMDFVVHDEEWIFLEINPNGQWAWLEHELKLPITQALVEFLSRGKSGA